MQQRLGFLASVILFSGVISTIIFTHVRTTGSRVDVVKPIEGSLKSKLPPKPEPKVLYGYNLDNMQVSVGRVKRNQNLSEILEGHNVSKEQLFKVSHYSKSVFDVRKLRSHRPYILICRNDSMHTASALIYERDQVHYVIYNFEDSVYVNAGKKEVLEVEKTVAGSIEKSLAETMESLDMSPQLTNDLADVFAWQIDFFRLYPGDQFKIIYNEKQVDGKPVGIGGIKGAYFKHDQDDFYAIYYDQGDGAEYFDREGKSLRKALLKYPVQFTRISSRYSGRRYHPILKRYRSHLGTDLAAPTGTPIRSVGDGKVLEAQYKGGSGNYVKIRHNGIYTTQYLHMSKIASGIRPGVSVKQGQLIGFVGSTGLATGPHVCYRFWKNGYQVDALKVELPSSAPIKDENLENFYSVANKVVQELDQIESPGKRSKLLVWNR